MDAHLHFSQGQDLLAQTNSYSSASSQPYPFSSSTWPPLYAQDMSDRTGDDLKFHASSAGSLDLKASTASPPAAQPLHSPAFDMSQAAMDSNFQATHINTSQPMGLHSPLQPSMDPIMSPLQLADMDGQLSSANLQIRTSMGAPHQSLQSTDSILQQALHASATMLQSTPLHYPIHGLSQQFSHQDHLPSYGAYDMPLHTSPTEAYMSTTQAQMDMLVSSSMDVMATPASAFVYQDLSQVMVNNWGGQEMLHGGINDAYVGSSMPLSTSDESFMPRSLSSNGDDHSFVLIEHSHGRRSLDGFSDISAGVGAGTAHVRADSQSSQLSDLPPHSAASTSSMEELLFGYSPEPESRNDLNAFNGRPSIPPREYPFSSSTQFDHPHPSPPLPSPTSVGSPTSNLVTAAHSPEESSSSSSSGASAANSPKAQRRNSPLVGVTPKMIAKKKVTPSSSKSEKRVGRRRGPLRPEQREQAHEIRKLRACLRCRFLKKVCDKGNPCGGCQPSHARLWQVPCTRIDIKDIGYFFKDWSADYERHITMGFSIANIKGFDTRERLLYITHGYGFVMPIWAREVFVRDDSCFGLDWVEQKEGEDAHDFEVQSAKLSAGADGISKKMVSDYVDLHLESGFDHFVTSYFDGTPFVSELLLSINKYYRKTQQADIRKGLRLVIAYALTLHITMINGLTDEEATIGKVDDPSSRYFGETCAPVMINFEVKKAMADLWRELMGDVLADLSSLYSAVYAGKKQKSWPTIFMLAALILSVWEMMQFDCHYRVPEEGAVTRFCDEMEHVPVGVVVGLFGAISTKLPGFQEWDATKHGNVFNNDEAVCNTMTEVRSHIEKHEPYLRSRTDAKFCRDDFDSLSNKFLSKLVIRA